MRSSDWSSDVCSSDLGALTAVMVGAFQIHGMEPGPLVLMTSKDLVWIVFVGMFLANLCIFGLGYVETKTIVHLLRVPFSILAPGILLIASKIGRAHV